MQVPAVVTFRAPEVSAHPVAVPSATTNVTVPAVVPPDVVNGNAVPYVPDVEVSDNVACEACATVAVRAIVSPVSKLVVSVGVNVAVIVAVPAPTIVIVEALNDTTDVSDDAYVNAPGVDGVGADTVEGASPKVAEIGDHVNVGVAFEMTTAPGVYVNV